MPVRPQPMTYTCLDCGWSKYVWPQSDCLLEGYDSFRVCPKCGSNHIQMKIDRCVPMGMPHSPLLEMLLKVFRS